MKCKIEVLPPGCRCTSCSQQLWFHSSFALHNFPLCKVTRPFSVECRVCVCVCVCACGYTKTFLQSVGYSGDLTLQHENCIMHKPNIKRDVHVHPYPGHTEGQESCYFQKCYNDSVCVYSVLLIIMQLYDCPHFLVTPKFWLVSPKPFPGLKANITHTYPHTAKLLPVSKWAINMNPLVT